MPAPDEPPPSPIGTPPDSLGRVNAGADGAYATPEMHCDATRLMTQAQAGDAAAFEELFKALRGRTFQVARSLVGSREDALDLTQEAFTKLYTARASYDPGQPFLPWFHRILRNACFSFLRKHGRLRTKSLQALDDDGEERSLELEDPGPAVGSELEAADERRVFQRALARLAPRDREILALRHYEDLSYKEIATALEIPEGTVMSRLFHARRRLGELLGPALGLDSSAEQSPVAAAGRRGVRR
jgi:RNA polymerase sigma-70 factor (ECF subfamily)